MKTVVVTGSYGLIGSEVCRFYDKLGFRVIGIDNDMRKYFFGESSKENLHDIQNSIIVTHEHKGDKFYNYLLLMSQCKHFIIPNSTFAWWAAYLSKNKTKKVLYPEIWLKTFNSECKLLYFGLDWEINS